MSRREAQFSDISITPSLKEDHDAAQKLLNDLDTSAIELLRRGFSVRSVVSTSSSFAARQQAALASDEPQFFRHIGAGTCGTVFEIPGSTEVVKRAKSGHEEELWNDCKSHKKITESFTKHADLLGELKVPQCGAFITHDRPDFWTSQGDLFPKNYREPTSLYFSERILPIPQSLRYALINLYIPEQTKSSAKEAQANKDCLVRLYLGKRRNPNRLKPTLVSLRNYNLCLDQMEQVGLDTIAFATTMARALALMHWEAHIDADDVEFVLGSSPTMNSTTAGTSISWEELDMLDKPRSTLPPTKVLIFRSRVVTMWLLDFNRCKKLFVKAGSTNTADCKDVADRRTESVQMAVDAFFQNDPYYPRPLSSNPHEQSIWTIFRDNYLFTGKTLLEKEEEELKEMPDRFISLVESTMETRLIKKAEAEARLAAMGSEGWKD
ncbi:hypothetical protein MMC18_001984 [Xylographa bjoerkii]|nr:hypothetical protein [Xylographa bjoerkii]